MKVDAPVLTSPRMRLSDLAALTKPRISLLVLFTVAAGALFAARGPLSITLLLNALFGTTLVAICGSVLNQVIERHSDALMHRTENRPIPSGRVHPGEALALGLALGVFGLVYLALTVPAMCTAVAAFTLFTYVGVYTPLKRVTTLNTLIGAVPGALPPVIGYAAVSGTLDAGAFALFLIVFIWQVPHFLAIAWIHRDDYARGGLKMLPLVDPEGLMTARQMVLYSLTLIPVSLIPVLLQRAGPWYAGGACFLGLIFLAEAIGFLRERSRRKARRVLLFSLAYLPVLLALLLLEPRLILGS